MATYDVNVRLGAKDNETGAPATTTVTHNIPFIAGLGSSLAPGDVLRFNVATKDLETTTASYAVTGKDTRTWTTGSTSFTVSSSSVSITVAAGATSGSDSITIDPVAANPNSAITVYFKQPDRTPDTPSFPNITGANPSDTVESAHVRITGIDNGTTVTISGVGGYVRKSNNEPATQTSITINDRDYIHFVCNTPSTFNTTRSYTITVGTWSATWTVTTRDIGDDISYIPVPYSGTRIALSDVIATFQNPTLTENRNMSAYLRAPAGNLVPDLAANAGVPTSLPVKLSDFIGAKNALYWVKKPQNRDYSWNTVANGTTTINTGWGIGGANYLQEWLLGFGDYLDEYAEIRYELSLDPGVSYSVDGGNPSVWSTANRWISLSATGVSGREDTFNATVTIYVRHPVFPSAVLTTVVTAKWFFWGV